MAEDLECLARGIYKDMQLSYTISYAIKEPDGIGIARSRFNGA